MKINNINQSKFGTNFQGAYIIKGSGKAAKRFTQEMGIQSLMNPKTPEAVVYELTEFVSESQPYMELLVCTGNHIENIGNKLMFDEQKKVHQITELIDYFGDLPEENHIDLHEVITKSLFGKSENDSTPKFAFEKPTEKNTNKFLDWYSDTIKNSNKIYKEMSAFGSLPFPAKIRRLDADKVSDALISGNFNIKEGFFRQTKNPKVEVEDINNNGNKIVRYVNGKIDSIIDYIDLPLSNDAKMLQTYTKLYYDKAGKLIKSTIQDFGGRFINSEKYNK